MCDDHLHHHHHHHTHDHGHDHGHGHHHGRRLSRRSLLSATMLMLSARAVCAQPVWNTEKRWLENAPRWHRQSWELKQKGLAQPFTGITTDGHIIPGLFPLRPTGITTAPMREAMTTFLSVLTPQQLADITFEVDGDQWRNWANEHWYDREGVSLSDMSPTQRDAFLHLVRACMSERGARLVRDIMKLNETLSEITDEHAYLGEWRYTVVVFGRPSPTDPWGWQLVGHHNIVNYFVLGDQVVMTPQFLGGEPVIATTGKYRGVAVLQDEQNQALRFVNALDDTARRQAILQSSKTGDCNVAEAFRDNIVLDYAGARMDGLSGALRTQLTDLIELYVGNLDDGHAKIKMDEVVRSLADTRFAWIGQTGPDSVFYYRIQSPVLLVEFDHQKPKTLGHFLPHPELPNRQHIHCLVRTPNGNDYGRDLLRQHHLEHTHT